jgi:hypothetical protein
MSYNHVTFLLCLPRSRSAWLAQFMRPYCAASWHNPLQQCASIEELGRKIDDISTPGNIFIADVAALFFFDKLVVRFPGAKYIIVHRPAHEVEHSMKRLNVNPPLNVRSAEKQLVELANSLRMRSDVMTGTFFELNSAEIVRAICRFVTGIVPPFEYYRRMARTNVQVPVAEQILRTDLVKQRLLFGSAKIVH